MLFSGQSIATATVLPEPVDLAQVKAHCRIDDDADDLYLLSLIATARASVEDFTGRALRTETRKAFYPCWGELILPRSPFVSLDHLKYYPAEGGSAVTVDPATYYVVSTREPARITLAYGKAWPVAALRPVDGIEAQFVCGYGSGAVPSRLLHAIKMLVSHWYSQREAVIVANPAAVDSKEVTYAVQALIAEYVLRYV